MAKKQSLNLTGSNFAGFQAVAETFKSVQYCELVSSRNVVGSVKEIVFLVTTPEETAEVVVWVIANEDKTYRKLFIAQKGQGESVMSTHLKFDVTKIKYFYPHKFDEETEEEFRRREKHGEEEARKFGPKNAEVCERLNNGEKFAFLCDRYGQFHGEEFNPFYSFIVMMNGTIMPLPVFLVAADAPTTSFDWYETTEEEVDTYLREHFGDQYTTFVEDRDAFRS